MSQKADSSGERKVRAGPRMSLDFAHGAVTSLPWDVQEKGRRAVPAFVFSTIYLSVSLELVLMRLLAFTNGTTPPSSFGL